MAVAASYEQRRLAAQWRRDGATWAEIAAALRGAYPDLGGFAAARQAHSWSQKRAADEWCAHWPDRPIEWKAISSWECWPGPSGRRPSLVTVERLARLYEVSASDLLAGWADYRTGTLALTQDRYPADVNRRTFLGSSIAAGVSVTLPSKGRIGSADVEELRAQYWALWHADQEVGSGAVGADTLALLDHVVAVRDQGSYGLATGRDLQVLCGLLEDQAAFLAFDGGDHERALTYWHRALRTARLADDDRLETCVAAEMAAQAQWLGRGREVVELTQLGQRLSRGWAPPRLNALLAGREAVGHALRGDAGQAQAALVRSEAELSDAGDDGESWFSPYTEAAFAAMTSKAWLALGAPVAAERAARSAISHGQGRRLRALNGCHHARALAAAGELDRARHTLGEAETLAQGVSSARLAADLAAVRRAVA